MQSIRVRHWLVPSLLLWASVAWPTRAAHHDGGGSATEAAAVACAVITTNMPTPFLDPLPIPPVARPARTNLNYRVPVATNLFYSAVPEYDMPMTVIQHQFHSNLPPVEVWGYAGSYPGPTFDVVVDQPILVNWINQLPTNYPSWLPIDTNFHGVPDQSVRSVVHLHGGTSLPRYDGHPENWFRTGESDQYFYGNIDPDDDGQTQWYHDHAVGVTGANVYAGLAGYYFLRNPAFEGPLNLPKGDFEIPLVFQDRDIQTNCQPASLAINVVFGLQIPWCYLPVVNGKVTPYLEVEPRRYRFRALNGANFRVFGLNMFVSDLQGVPIAGAPAAPPFTVIGTEDGFLEKPVTVSGTNSLTIMSGERVDFIIDFTGLTNSIITVQNLDREVPFPPQITNLMQFRVTRPLSSPDTSTIPAVLNPNFHPTSNMVARVVRTRNFTLDMNSEEPFPGPPFTSGDLGTNPSALINMLFFHDPVTEMPHAGDTEIWNIINLSNEPHPFHVHLTDFRLIDRVLFAGSDTNPPTMVAKYINDRLSTNLQSLTYYLSTNANDTSMALPYENGPKDTVHAVPFALTRIVMTWPTNSFYYTTVAAMSSHNEAGPGTYVYHCHLLAHEDNDMMRPFQLISPYLPSLQLIPDASVNPAGNNHFKLGFDTRTNDVYTIQTTSETSFLNWLALPGGSIPGSGSFFEITPPPSVNPVGFYRIERKIGN